MKEIFIVWITIQLIIMGMASVSAHNDIIDKTYNCRSGEKLSILWGTIFPLALFTTDDREVIKYCNY